jgi:hypothetical protein
MQVLSETPDIIGRARTAHVEDARAWRDVQKDVRATKQKRSVIKMRVVHA